MEPTADVEPGGVVDSCNIENNCLISLQSLFDFNTNILIILLTVYNILTALSPLLLNLKFDTINI